MSMKNHIRGATLRFYCLWRERRCCWAWYYSCSSRVPESVAVVLRALAQINKFVSYRRRPSIASPPAAARRKWVWNAWLDQRQCRQDDAALASYVHPSIRLADPFGHVCYSYVYLFFSLRAVFDACMWIGRPHLGTYKRARRAR
jgi:hypothetical protein